MASDTDRQFRFYSIRSNSSIVSKAVRNCKERDRRHLHASLSYPQQTAVARSLPSSPLHKSAEHSKRLSFGVTRRSSLFPLKRPRRSQSDADLKASGKRAAGKQMVVDTHAASNGMQDKADQPQTIATAFSGRVTRRTESVSSPSSSATADVSFNESRVLIPAEMKCLADGEMKLITKQPSTLGQRSPRLSSKAKQGDSKMDSSAPSACGKSKSSDSLVEGGLPAKNAVDKKMKGSAVVISKDNGDCKLNRKVSIAGDRFNKPVKRPLKLRSRFLHSPHRFQSRSPVKPLIGERPKRNVVPKNVDTISGLSWEEEANLHRALSASLHESRYRRRSDSATGGVNGDETSNDSHEHNSAHLPGFDAAEDQNSRTSNSECYPIRVRAQRKFASNSVPSSPFSGAAVHSNRPPEDALSPDLRKMIVGRRLTTDEFLTFLCIRASPTLPTHLQIFGYGENENLVCPSCPSTPTGVCPGSVAPFSRLSRLLAVHASESSSVSNDDSNAPQASHSAALGDDLGVMPLPCATPAKKPSGTDDDNSSSDGPRSRTSNHRRSNTRENGSAGRHSVSISSRKQDGSIARSTDRKSSNGTPKTPHEEEHGISATPKSAGVARRSRPPIHDNTWRLDRQTMNVVSRLINLRKMRLTPNKTSVRGGRATSLKSRLRESTRTVTKATDNEEILRLTLQELSPRFGVASGAETAANRVSGVGKSSTASTSTVVNSSSSGKHSVATKVNRSADHSPSSSQHPSGRKEMNHGIAERQQSEGRNIAISKDAADAQQKRKRQSPDGNSAAKRKKTTEKSSPHDGEQKVKVKPADENAIKVGVNGEAATNAKCRKSLAFVGNGAGTGCQNGEKSTANNVTFTGTQCPLYGDHVVEAPTYRPTAEQFNDLLAYIDTISAEAREYGMCRIVPPLDGWKLECNVSDDLRFTSQTQYVHKMRDRWGPNVMETACIKRLIEKQGGRLDSLPQVGGVDMDIVALSTAVNSCGGLQRVIDKNKWPQVIEKLHLPKVAREKTVRMYEIYCKQLLPYDTLSTADKRALEKDVLERRNEEDNDLEPCVTKGRLRNLSEFFCTARNTLSMYFDSEPMATEVETAYWRFVNERKNHVAVQAARVVDDSVRLKKQNASIKGRRTMSSLQQNSSSVLSHLKQQLNGVTVPMLNISMLFSTNCWSRNPHLLPTINYTHTGSDTVWYCVPGAEEDRFKKTFDKLVPDLIDEDAAVWLPEESVMVSPAELQREGGVRLCRAVQQQGQFIVVFPESFTANVACGYSIAEQINYATCDWIPLGCHAAKQMESCGHPELFSTDELLVTLATDDSTSGDVLRVIQPHLEAVISSELRARQKLVELGVQKTKNWNSILSRDKHGQNVATSSERRCYLSEKICYLSAVTNDNDGTVYSSEQAASKLQRRKNVSAFRLRCRLDDRELQDILLQVRLKMS